jgi:hypothetical protein
MKKLGGAFLTSLKEPSTITRGPAARLHAYPRSAHHQPRRQTQLSGPALCTSPDCRSRTPEGLGAAPSGHAPHEGRPHVVITHHPSRRHHSRRCQSLHAISEHKRLNLTQPETNTAEALTAHLQRTARRPRHTHRNHKPHTPRFRVPVPKPSRAPAPQAAPALCTQPSSRGPAMVLGLGPGPPSPSESQDRHPHRLLGARQTRLRRRGNRK